MDGLTGRLRKTFIPEEIPPGAERRTVVDQPVIIYRPKNKIDGLTFVIGAANMPLSKYASIIAALNSENHVVIGFFVNILNPPLRNHRVKAERIAQIFQELKREFRVDTYDIVGHSIGGKIALLVTALYDENNLVRNITALDPVDQHPIEFTNETSKRKLLRRASNATSNGSARRLGGANGSVNGSVLSSVNGDASPQDTPSTNLDLRSSRADITLTCTDSGYFINKKHNAREIQNFNPSVKLVMHRNSCHMVYCDDDGLISWKALMGRGKSADHNQRIRDETISLVKERAVRSNGKGKYNSKSTSKKKSSSNGKKSSGGKNMAGKAKKAMSNGMNDLNEIGRDAKRMGQQAAAMSKVMG
eukprot:CAMPEP_0183737104 /NCGR_PEP_ID=MMETSP0737-20130205/51051_1 /TAXON_ID=385413 /ORGANISM="Thalassiosira miniscula, Strain CCMP1093" /LENGTH=359 /DNA_ID=CAMNT_0025971301 /DNA_START=47 /DNA_END=1126 /DNA_ORIENTATION=+